MSFYPTFPLEGIFGGPLALLRGIIGNCPTYLAFNPDGTVYLYADAPESKSEGDVYVMLAYEDEEGNPMGGLVGTRTDKDPGISGFQWSRKLAAYLIRVTPTPTSDDRDAMVNLGSTIFAEILSHDTTAAIKQAAMGELIWNTTIDPNEIGIKMHFTL